MKNVLSLTSKIASFSAVAIFAIFMVPASFADPIKPDVTIELIDPITYSNGHLVNEQILKLKATVALPGQAITMDKGTIDFSYLKGTQVTSICQSVSYDSNGVAECTLEIPSSLTGSLVFYATFQSSDTGIYISSENNTGYKIIDTIHETSTTLNFDNTQLRSDGSLVDSQTVRITAEIQDLDSAPNVILNNAGTVDFEYTKNGTSLKFCDETPLIGGIAACDFAFRDIYDSTTVTAVFKPTYPHNYTSTPASIIKKMYYITTFDGNEGTWNVSGTSYTQLNANLKWHENPLDIKFGAPLVHPDGKIFRGWKISNDATDTILNTYSINSDIVLKAHWTRYFGYFDANGGSWGATTVLSQDNLLDGEEIVPKYTPNPNPTRINFEFLGWGDTRTATTTLETSKIESADKTLFAIWKKVLFTATFKPMEGQWGTDTRDQVTLPKASGLDAFSFSPGIPTKIDFAFAGWKLVADGKIYDSYLFNDVDLIFEAQWVPGYRGHFIGNGGSWIADGATEGYTAYLAVGTDVLEAQPSIDPVKTGEAFYGWGSSSTSTVNDVLEKAILGNQTLDLYAIWGPGYQATFNPNGGNWSGSTASQISKLLPSGFDSFDAKPLPPQRVGYTFGGWQEESSTNNVALTTLLFTDKNLDFKAIWLPNTYNLTFDTQGGSSISATTYTFGSSKNLPSAPTKNDFTFKGWFISSSGGTALGTTYTADVPGDKVLFAQWEANSPSSGGGIGSGSTGGGSGGGSPAPDPTPTVPTPAPVHVKQDPSIIWNPSDIFEGDEITSTEQLNAVFSVPGIAKYSIAAGRKLYAGAYTISVIFTPTDVTNFNEISASRTIQIKPKPLPTPSPTPTIIPSPEPTVSESPKPSPSQTTTATPLPTSSKTPVPSPAPKTTSSPTPSSGQVSKTDAKSKSGKRLLAVIYFPTNEYFIDKSRLDQIMKIAQLIKVNRISQISIEGHTDISSGKKFDWIAKFRAQAVALKLKPLVRARISASWFGSDKPAYSGTEKASLAQNRRVEIYTLTSRG